MSKVLLSVITICVFIVPWNIVEARTAEQKNKIKITAKAADISQTAKIELSRMFKSYQVFNLEPFAVYNNVRNSGSEITFQLNTGTDVMDLELTRTNYVSHDYVLLVGTKNGVQRYSKPSIVTYKGKVAGQPDSKVTLTVSPNRIYARINSNSGDLYLENTEDLTATHDLSHDNYLLYKAADMAQDVKLECLAAATTQVEDNFPEQESANRSVACQTVVELAYATTYDVLDFTNGDVSALQTRLLHTLAMVNSLYEPVGINNILTAMYISESTGMDPISQSTDIRASRPNFTNWANGGGFGNVQFDAATLWVGRDLCDGSVGCGASGIAAIGSICGTEKHNVCEHMGAQLYNMVNSGHELAHNWGANHLSGNNINVMSPLISGANQTWSNTTINVFNSKRSMGCFDNCSQKPVANMSISNLKPCVGEEILFYDASQVAPTNWQWDFGDGTTSNKQNPTHVYNSAGTKTISLTVTNESGQSDTKTLQIGVGGSKPETKVVGIKRTDVTGEFLPASLGFSVYQKFTAETDIIIESFKVSTNSSGKRSFKIYPVIPQPNETNVLADIAVDLPSGNDHEVKVHWELAPGSYWLLTDGGNGVYTCGVWRARNIANRYPYREAGLISITESSNDDNGAPGSWLGPYEWKVRRQAECGTVVGLEEAHVSDYKVYPNPGNGLYNIELPYTNESKVVNVFDVVGQLKKTIAFAGNIQKDQLDLTDLAPGTYFINIESSSHSSSVLKVVKQ